MIDDLKPYPAYKDSGLPWLGEVPRHWQTLSVRRFCHVFAGATPSRTVPDYWMNGKIPWLASGDVNLRRIKRASQFITETGFAASSTKWIRPGSLVVALAGQGRTKGMVATVEFATTCNQSLGVLEPSKNRSDYRFLAYFLESRYLDIRGLVGNGIRDGLNLDHLKSIPTPLPPLAEQATIVRFLDHADLRIRRYIGTQKKLITLLNEQKQAIIHRAVTRGLDPNIRLKPSGVEWLGAMPEHWELLRLKDLSPRISGRLVYQPAQYFSEDGVPFIMGNNVTQEGVRWSGVRRIPREINDRFAHHALREGDVITVRVGAPGVTCVVPKEADGLNCGSLMIVRRGTRFNSRWLAYTMNSAVIRTQIALVQYGAAQEQINIEDAVNFLLPVPPLEEQERLARILSLSTAPLARAVELAATTITSIHEYRTRLIADVVTGKLDVREAAARLPDQADEPEPLDDAADETDGEGLVDGDPETTAVENADD